MRTLHAAEAIHLWEWASDKHPIDRGLCMLEAYLGPSAERPLEDLPIGRRDALLLDVREALTGPEIEMVVHCPKCSEHLEFTLTTSQLRVDTPATDPDRRFRLQSGDQDLRFRLPTTADQVALRDVQSPVAAREILRHRVCCSAERDGTTIAPDQISEDVWTALEAQIAELDKQADLRLGVSCMECGHEWGAAFDPMPFLWEELTTQVRMLCREVFMLAQHYGWSEAEILAMNPKRRQWYLELIG